MSANAPGTVGLLLGFNDAACFLDEKVTCGDVPQIHTLLDIGIKPPAGDVGEIERGGTHRAQFTGFVSVNLIKLQAMID